MTAEPDYLTHRLTRAAWDKLPSFVEDGQCVLSADERAQLVFHVSFARRLLEDIAAGVPVTDDDRGKLVAFLELVGEPATRPGEWG